MTDPAIKWQSVARCTPATHSKTSGTASSTLATPSAAAVTVENGWMDEISVFVLVAMLFSQCTKKPPSVSFLFRAFGASLLKGSHCYSDSIVLSYLQCEAAHVALLPCRRMAQGPEGRPGGSGMRSVNRRPCTSPS